MTKLRPLIDSLNKKLLQFGVFNQHVAVDECMVPYHGHHSSKMCIRDKPIRFGYKLWVLASSDGFPFKIDVYSGKSTDDSGTPLGMRVVKELTSCLVDKSLYNVYMDNFFTSEKLLSEMRKHGLSVTGTVRSNRVGGCPLTPQKQFKKTERGTMEAYGDGKVIMPTIGSQNLVDCCVTFEILFIYSNEFSYHNL